MLNDPLNSVFPGVLEILLALPHQHGVFTVPKRIRPFFKFNRGNMSMLYQAAWRAWQECVTQQCPDGTSGAVMALHSAGDLIAFHPHIHAFLLSGALRADGNEPVIQLLAVRDGKNSVRSFSILEFLAELQQHTCHGVALAKTDSRSLEANQLA